MLDALEQYVIECENRRRRMRQRPSNEVVAELRVLLDFFKAVRDERRARGDEDDPRASAGLSAMPPN